MVIQLVSIMGFEDKNYFSLKSTGPLPSSIQHWWWEVVSQFDSHFFVGDFEMILWDFLEYSTCLNGMTRFGSFFINWAVHCGSFQSDDIDSSVVLGNILSRYSLIAFCFLCSSVLMLVIGYTSMTVIEYLFSARHYDTLEVNGSYECLHNACPGELHPFLSFCIESRSRKLMFFLVWNPEGTC